MPLNLKVEFDDQAIKYLRSPPSPSKALRDIILSIRTSTEINSLAMMGRNLLHCSVMGRLFEPPISTKFNIEVDEKMNDNKLAHVAQNCGLLKRLNVEDVAMDTVDIAHVLCAYLGAIYFCVWKRSNNNAIHTSVNDICALVMDDDEPGIVENNSHERMSKLSAVERMSTPVSLKSEPPNTFAPTPTRPSHPIIADSDMASNESVSSGRSPPPHLYGTPHYQQPYQPYYPPNPSNPPNRPLPMQYIYPHAGPQRFASYPSGPVPTSSPSFTPSPQSAYQHGHMAFQPSYEQIPPPGGQPPQPGPYDQYAGNRVMPMNSQSYGAPMQPPPPVAPPSMPMPPPTNQQTQGFISLFNELAMKHRLTSSWQQQKSGQQHIPEWTMWLLVDGQPKGYGVAPTKQGAKEIAAKAALQAMGWLAP